MGSHKGDPIEIIGAISDCKFRVTPSDIAPYFLLSFSEQKNISPIDEIILGPKNQMEMYKIRTFLSMNDLNGIDIKYSKSSYRWDLNDYVTDMYDNLICSGCSKREVSLLR